MNKIVGRVKMLSTSCNTILTVKVSSNSHTHVYKPTNQKTASSCFFFVVAFVIMPQRYDSQTLIKLSDMLQTDTVESGSD